MEIIQEKDYNDKWGAIISCIHQMVSQEYKVGASQVETGVASTPYSIGSRVALYTAVVKKATGTMELGHCVDWKKGRKNGQTLILEFG